MMPGRGATGLTLAAACLATGCSKHAGPEGEPLRVAAAADLSFAFVEIGAAFEKATGRRVAFSFGSTGLLEKQIAEGAPFDVFAAADVTYADDAVSAGACLSGTKLLYATGRIVIFAAPGASFTPRGIRDLADTRVTKIAIANPEHAPYGRAAREALMRAGVWPAARSKLVYGDNVHQALQFALSGNADVAIVALSLAVATPGEWTPISSDLHDRIDQALVVCTRGKAGPAAGERFAAYIGSPDGRAVMHKYGFLLPGESMSEQRAKANRLAE
jgi:molybdate transport system substrate-binding protein